DQYHYRGGGRCNRVVLEQRGEKSGSRDTPSGRNNENPAVAVIKEWTGMALTAEQLAEQKKKGGELRGTESEKLGFAKALFYGRFNAPLLFPYPELKPEEKATVEQAVADVRRFCEQHIDAAAIDRNADIPPEAIAGLGELGVLGMTTPKEFGGRGFSQLGNAKVLEAIGGHCGSTAVFVNAHHSIGIRAIILFGTEEQKRRWLPDLASGKKLGAFALTEPEAGSDAA